MRSSRMSAKLMPFSCRYDRALPICWDITSEYSSDFACSPSSKACSPADIPKDSVRHTDAIKRRALQITRSSELCMQLIENEAPTCLSCNRSLDLRKARPF